MALERERVACGRVVCLGLVVFPSVCFVPRAKKLTLGSLSKFPATFFFVTALSLGTSKISAKKLFLNTGVCIVVLLIPFRSFDDGQFQPPFAVSQLLRAQLIRHDQTGLLLAPFCTTTRQSCGYFRMLSIGFNILLVPCERPKMLIFNYDSLPRHLQVDV